MKETLRRKVLKCLKGQGFVPRKNGLEIRRVSALVVEDVDMWNETGKDGKADWVEEKGMPITIRDTRTGKRFSARVRIKAVRCGKPTCKKYPHKIYAYAQFRDGKKVREKYLGIAR